MMKKTSHPAADAPQLPSPPSRSRPGEVRLDDDPAKLAADAGVVFIGSVSSPWQDREECPKNMAAARLTGKQAALQIAEPYRPGLAGLSRYSHLVVLTWFDRARRDLIVQQPRHAAAPRGVFALRSPVRPNPIGVHVVRLLSADEESGRIEIDAIDVLDGTPIVDVKPYFASTDSFSEASGSEAGEGG
jgi:tRNA (adenine37-N6)-methyltransferase